MKGLSFQPKFPLTSCEGYRTINIIMTTIPSYASRAGEGALVRPRFQPSSQTKAVELTSQGRIITWPPARRNRAPRLPAVVCLLSRESASRICLGTRPESPLDSIENGLRSVTDEQQSFISAPGQRRHPSNACRSTGRRLASAVPQGLSNSFGPLSAVGRANEAGMSLKQKEMRKYRSYSGIRSTPAAGLNHLGAGHGRSRSRPIDNESPYLLQRKRHRGRTGAENVSPLRVT